MFWSHFTAPTVMFTEWRWPWPRARRACPTLLEQLTSASTVSRGSKKEQPAEIGTLRGNRRIRRRHVLRKRLKQSLSVLEPLRFGLRCGCRRNHDQQRDAGEAEV